MSSDGIFIRIGTMEDAHELGKLWLQMAEETYPGKPHDVGFWRGNYIRCLASMEVHYDIVVAEHDGRLIGFTDAHAYYCPFIGGMRGHITSIFVLPEFRDSTAAQRMARELLRWGRRREVALIEFMCPPHLYEYWHGKGYEPSMYYLTKPLAVKEH